MARLATGYWKSIVMELTVSLDPCTSGSYTVNSTVSNTELGRYTSISEIDVPWTCPSESK